MKITFDWLKDHLNTNLKEEKLLEQTGVIGEKVQINKFVKITAPYVGSYIHAGNKIATIVGLSSICENADLVSKDITMQVAAMNPIAIDESSVDHSLIEKEIEIVNIDVDGNNTYFAENVLVHNKGSESRPVADAAHTFTENPGVGGDAI